MDQRCLSFHVALEWNLSQAIKEPILDFCEVCSSSSLFGEKKSRDRRTGKRTSFTISRMFLSSSRLWREVTEKTRMKAWPLDMESRCMAGNWCEPVVSVIWRVHIELLDEIT